MSLSAAQRLTSPGTPAAAPASPSLRISVIGATALTVSVAGRDTGFSTPLPLQFVVKPMPRVEILPRAGSYHGPVEVSVAVAGAGGASPVPIVITVDGQPRYGGTTFTLDTPGAHTVEAYTQSFADRGPATTAAFDLSPLQLQPPAVSPDPAAFWADFLFVSPLVLTLPESAVPGVVYEVSVSSGSQGAARVSRVAANSASTVELATASEDRFVVELRAVAADAAMSTFLLPSATRTVALRVAPFGDSATPFFRLDLAVDPTPSNCAGLARRLSDALFLSSALGVGAQAVVHRCARRPAFRVTGLPKAAVDGYARWIVNDLASANAGSRIYAALGGAAATAAPVASVDQQVFASGCAAVSTETYFGGSSNTADVAPGDCGARCLAGTNAASVLLADGGKCACLSTVSSPGVAVEIGRCGTPCTAEPESTCGGREASATTTLATHYSVINTTAGSRAALFPIVYGFAVATAGTLSTSSAFSLRVSAANLPNADGAAPAGRVKFITDGQTCASLAPEYAFPADGLVSAVLLRRAAVYRVCSALTTSAGSDDAGVFRELPPLAGGTDISIVQGEDVPVTVTPASGVLAAPAEVTVACETAGAMLVVTLDQEAPVVVPGPSYTFVVRSLGSHLVSAHATTSGNAIGLPVTRAYTVVDPRQMTTTAAPQPPAPPGPSGDASALGIRGYTYVLTTERRVLVRLDLDEPVWRASACGDAASDATCAVVVTSAGTCAGANASAFGLSSPLQRSTNTDAFAFETAVALDFGELPMSRDALTVCVTTTPQGAAMPIAPTAAAWQLSPAVQGTGLCSKKQAALCAAESRCAARLGVRGGGDELVCICGGAAASSEAELSVFCTGLLTVPEELRGARTWNGTTAITIGTPAPALAVPEQQGSYVSLFVLLVIFAASTATLCYVKRRPQAAAGTE